MKNVILVILSLVVIVLGYLAFHKKGPMEPEEAPIVTEEPIDKTPAPTFGAEEDHILTEDVPLLKYTMHYPSFGNATVDAELKNFVMGELALFKNENTLTDNHVGQNTFDVTYKTVRSPKMLSVIFSISGYTGGAHGSLVIKTRNYDMTGKRIVLGGLFKANSGYLARLSELSKPKVEAKMKEMIGNSYPEFEEGLAPTNDNFNAFYLDADNNLVIVFQPYQVGPWVVGAPEIIITQSEIGSIIDPVFAN